MSEKTGLELTREFVKRAREDMKKAGGTMTVDELHSGIDEREAFEKWYSNDGVWPQSIERNADGEYSYAPTAVNWIAWQARAALAATPVQEVVPPEPVPSGMCLVNAGALQMVINALRRDAAEGKTVRGEMADELLATGGQGQVTHKDKRAAQNQEIQ